MKKFCLILLLILVFGEMLDDDKQCGSMNMSGGKPSGISVDAGVGPNAKLCPITGKVLKPGQEIEMVLSNRKKIRLCCPDCRKPVEKDLKKYEGLMY